MISDGFSVHPVGYVRSALRDPKQAPRQGNDGAPAATLVFDSDFEAALSDIRIGESIVLLTWLHLSSRDKILVRPGDDPEAPLTGVFSTRSPGRPNPIGLHVVAVEARDALALEVAALEAVDGTPILDIKPLLKHEMGGRL